MRSPSAIYALAGMAYAYGIVLTAFMLGPVFAFGGEVPSLSWWQWALVPAAIGTLALVIQSLMTGIARAARAAHLGRRIVGIVLAALALLAVVALSLMRR